MAITLAVGTRAQIASVYAASVNISAITNATQAVATLSSATGVVVGSYLQLTSGWGALDGRVVRVAAVATNDVTLEGVNTTDLTQYPAGSGNGTARRIITWTEITQLTAGIQLSGGDQQFADATTLADRIQRQIPTVRSPVSLTLPTFFDESLGWVAAVRSAADAVVATGVMLIYPGNARTVGAGYFSMREVPTIEDNTLRGEISVAFAARPINYAT